MNFFKNTKNFLFVFTLLSVFLISCEPDEGGDFSGDLREEYVGSWSVTEENSSLGTSNYTVNIEKSTSENEVWVKNFNNLGNSTKIRFELEDNNITIPMQVFNANEMQGTGNSSIKFDIIELNYTVKTGGETETVEATLLKN